MSTGEPRDCVQCLKDLLGGNPWPTYTYETKPAANGWICPKCGSVYAPSILVCIECNVNKKPKVVDTTVFPNVDSNTTGTITDNHKYIIT